MSETVTLNGIIIGSYPAAEADKMLTILTKESGKIKAYVRGARRPKNQLGALCQDFYYCEFSLNPGRDYYYVKDIKVLEFFEHFRTDVEATLYASYFCELAGYYGRENNDDLELLKLLYQTFRALGEDSFDKKLIRSIFEIKAIAVNGEFPGFPTAIQLSDSTKYTIQYIVDSTIEKLYTFKVTAEVQNELEKACLIYCGKLIDRSFKSLEILNVMC